MFKTGVVLCLMFFLACNSKDAGSSEDTGSFNYENFAAKFKKPALPYILSDTQLLKQKDTAALNPGTLSGMIPDSVTLQLFGKNSKVNYIPLAQVNTKDAENYFIVKAVTASRKVALLFVFDKDEKIGGIFPFLVPDADPATTQTSSIDKSFSIKRAVSRKMKNDLTAEGDEVFIYNEALKTFTMIKTDVLDNSKMAVLNPIDTFPKKSKFAGDYLSGKRGIVSIRDSKNPSEILFFIHHEKGEDCTGELRGTALFTSSATAVYRPVGDPCILELNFSGRTASIREVGGCGSHRSVGCVFEGSYTKKTDKTKTPVKKGKKK